MSNKRWLWPVPVIHHCLTAFVTSTCGDDPDNVIHKMIRWKSLFFSPYHEIDAFLVCENRNTNTSAWFHANILHINVYFRGNINKKESDAQQISSELVFVRLKVNMWTAEGGANHHYGNNGFQKQQKLFFFYNFAIKTFKSVLKLCFSCYIRPFVIALQLVWAVNQNDRSDDEVFYSTVRTEIFKFIHSFIPVWLHLKCANLAPKTIMYLSVLHRVKSFVSFWHEYIWGLKWFPDIYHSTALERGAGL